MRKASIIAFAALMNVSCGGANSTISAAQSIELSAQDLETLEAEKITKLPFGFQSLQSLESRDCGITISFSSYASGPDGALGALLKNRLLPPNEVTEIVIAPWGKEGEFTYCVVTSSDDKVAHLYISLVKDIKDYGGPIKGGVTIGTKAGQIDNFSSTSRN